MEFGETCIGEFVKYKFGYSNNEVGVLYLLIELDFIGNTYTNDNNQK